MAEFTAAFAQRLPAELRLVAFTSPTSFREPEIDNCWHPRFVGRSRIAEALCQLPRLLRSAASGVRRWLTAAFGSVTFLPGADRTTIAITPVSLCTIRDGRVISDYCPRQDAESVSWIVIDEAASDLQPSSFYRMRVAVAWGKVLSRWFRTSLKRFGQKDWMIASWLSLRWILGLQWAILWNVSIRVESLLQQNRPMQIFAIHEMWPWARAIWMVARRCHIRSVAVQHASITRSKLWYFPMEVERAAGFAAPDVFAVFSEKERSLLLPYFPSTQFLLRCAPRYAHWKNRASLVSTVSRDGTVLFVSSIPWWDNDVVLAAAAHISTSGSRQHRIAIRLHPSAVVPSHWKRWLSRAISAGLVWRSTATLPEELEHARVVIGMNTTVLEEAAAMGKAVLVLEDPRYLSFAPSLGRHLEASHFSWQAVEEAALGAADLSLVSAGRRALGLDLPELRLSEIGAVS